MEMNAEYFHAIFEASPEAICLSSLDDMRLLAVNPAFCALFCLSREQMIGRSVRELNLCENPDEIERLFANLREGVEIRDVELGYKNCAGQAGDLLLSLKYLNLGGRDCALVSGRDISGRKQLERVLAEQSAMLNQVINSMGQGLTVTNEERVFELVNPAYARLFGYKPEDLLGKNPLEVTAPEAREGLLQAHARRQQGEISTYESGLLRADGSIAPVLVTGSPRLKDGRVIGSVAVITDLTEIRAAQAAIAHRARALNALQASVLDISSPRPLSELLNLVVERAVNLLEASSGALYLVENQRRRVSCAVSYKTIRDFTGTTLDFGVGAAGFVAESGQPLVLDDYSSWPGRAEVYEKERPFTGVMCAPMLWQGQVIGVIDLMREAGAQKFTQEDLDILILFANHAAITVGNARLLVRLEQELSERKRAESALRASEEHLREVLDNSLDGSYKRNLLTNHYDYFSPAFARTSGYTPDEIISMSLKDMLSAMHPDDIPEVDRVMNTALSGPAGQAYQLEYRFRHKNGEYRWFRDNFTVLRAQTGQPLALIGSVSDISERKQAEAALLDAHRRLEGVVEGTNIGTWEWNVQTGETIFNETWAQIIGYSLAELAPINIQTWWKHIHPEDVLKSEALLHRHFSGELPYYDCECRMLHRDGHLIWVHDRGKVLSRSADGKPLLMFGAHYDVTARKQAEEALLKSEMRFRTIITASPVPMALNHELKYLSFVNTAFVQTFGYSLDEIPTLADFLPKAYPDLAYRQWVDETWQAHREQAARSGDAFVPLEIRVRCKNGTDRTVLASATPIPSTLKDEHLVVFYDITARKAAEEALEAARAELEQRVQARTADLSSANVALAKALRARDEFLAMMSHELRTPLTGIIGLAQSLQYSTYGELNDKQLLAVQHVEESGRHLHGMIDTILDYSRLQSGRAELQILPCALTAICHASLQSIQALARSKNQSVEFNPPLVENIVVRADERRLRQALSKLLDNAVKFTPEQGRITLAIDADRETRLVRIRVSDTGIGIKSEDFARLFQPFQQLDMRLSRLYNGTGLGLVMVKLLAELHGGSVEVESVFGQGSCFTLSLPWEE